MSLILILLLQFTAAAAEQCSSHCVAQGGANVIFPCENVSGEGETCGDINWLFTSRANEGMLELVENGQINGNATVKSDMLSFEEKCSLVLKNVTVEHAGIYTCRQSEKTVFQDSHFYLILINMTERSDDDKVTLGCSLLTLDHCRHTLEWLYEGKRVEGNKAMKTWQNGCSVAVTFPSSYHKYQELFKCSVKDKISRRLQLFPCCPQSSGASGEVETIIQGWLRYIIVSLALAAFVVSVVTVNIWKRTKEKKTQADVTAVPDNANGDENKGSYENVRDLYTTVRYH